MPDSMAQWTETERWVWQQITEGRAADLNARSPEAVTLDPRTAEGWDSQRRLSISFLTTILSHKGFTGSTPSQGVRIVGALLDDDPLDLEYLSVDCQIWLDACRILGEINASCIKMLGTFSLEGSLIAGAVNLSMSNLDGGLVLTGSTFESDVDLSGARIGYGLWMHDLTAAGSIDLTETQVRGSAELSSGAFRGPVMLPFAQLTGRLDMRGSRFSDEVDLSSANIAGLALLSKLPGDKEDKRAEFGGKVDLTYARIGSQLQLSSATARGDLDLNSVYVAGSLLIDEHAKLEGKTDLSFARIGGQLSISGAEIDGPLDLRNAEITGRTQLASGCSVNGQLDASLAKFGSGLEIENALLARRVDLSECECTGDLTVGGASEFRDEVELQRASVSGDLIFDRTSFSESVDLSAAHVRGSMTIASGALFESQVVAPLITVGQQTEIEGATFRSTVSLEGGMLSGYVSIDGGAEFEGGLNLTGAQLESHLFIDETSFGSDLDMIMCSVRGALGIGPNRIDWSQGSVLRLAQMHAGTLLEVSGEALECCWPEHYELEGFTYGRIARGSPSDEEDLGEDVEAHVRWLGGSSGASPQPYEQLAGCLRQMGEVGKAHRILYEARERRRRQLWRREMSGGRQRLEALGMLLLRWTIGYGLGNRYFRVIWWVAGLTILGAAVLYAFGSRPEGAPGPPLLFASLDHLLPVVSLDGSHDVLVFGSAGQGGQPYGVRVYFYVHKIAGWILGSFLVAGLAGLTQRSRQ